MYINYHKHSHYSSIWTPDSCITVKEYLDRIVELGHKIYFTTEHGFGGDIFEPFDLREKNEEYKDIKICYGVEAYISKDKDDKENHHIMIMAKTNEARKKINKIVSESNTDNFYYKPRLTVESIKTLDPSEVYITTACIAGILRSEESIENIFKPLHEHFKDSLFLEVQNHNEETQKETNKKILKLAKETGLKIVHANDSHYIYPEQKFNRTLYLKGKGISYGSEDNFILDYPDEEEIKKRYKMQGVLSDKEIDQAIANTNIFEDCEEIEVDRTIKMPTIYKDLSLQERMKKLEDIVYAKWEKVRPTKEVWKWEEYEKAIELELDIIRNTNDVVHTADYFLLNYEIIKEARKRGGVLTQTSRGSGGSFLINYLLGITGLDRLSLNVPLYPTRFMSESRLLETRSLPDKIYVA